jgi:hypothetical protein
VIERPVARGEGLLVEAVGDETVIYDLGTKEAHCLKPLAAAVFMYADGQNTAAEIAELAAYRLGSPVSEADTSDALTQLGGAGLLDGPLVVQDGVSRRDALRRMATVAGVAAAAPLITSIVAPSVALAGASKIPAGCTGCGQNKDCASNHCCQTVAGKSCNESCCVGTDNSCHLTSSGSVNTCTVQLSGGCPCVCGTSGCSPTPDGTCCPQGSSVCCTTT